jgi:hypothetical protein
MIPINNPIQEPDSFNKECREKGNKWLESHPTGRPKDYWSSFRDIYLRNGFNKRCGYGAMYLHKGTVDHFVSCNENRNLAYEWSNYRYIDGSINSRKQAIKYKDILDPFEVQEGWFEILLPSLQLVLTDKVPPQHKKRAQNTIERLCLVDHESILKVRAEWLQMYEEGCLPFDGLSEIAPLIAQAIQKRDQSKN